MIQGYGDVCCYVINDLLNQELLRRDYKFEIPEYDTFNNEEPEKENKDVTKEEEDNNDRYLIGKMPPVNEELSDVDIEEDKKAPVIKELEEHKFLESMVDPEAWSGEFNRIKSSLANENLMKSFRFKNFEYLHHIQEFNSYAKQSRSLLNTIKPSIEKLADQTEDSLNKILRFEKEVNRTINPKLSRELTEVRERKINIAELLFEKRDNVKVKIEQFEKINREYENKLEKINSNSEKLTDSSSVLRMKDSITKLKVHLRQEEIQRLDEKLSILNEMKLSKEKLDKE